MDKSHDFQNSGEDSSEERPSRFQEKGIPNLGVSSDRKINLKIMIFIGAVMLSIMALFYYILIGGMRKTDNDRVKQTAVSIPQQPVLPPNHRLSANILPPDTPEVASAPISLRSERLNADPLKITPTQPSEPSYSVTSYGVNMHAGYKASGIGGFGNELAKRRGMDSGAVVTALDGKILNENSPSGSVGHSLGLGRLGSVGDLPRAMNPDGQNNAYLASDALGLGQSAGGGSGLDALGLTGGALSGSLPSGLNTIGVGHGRNTLQQVSVDSPTTQNTLYRPLTADVPPGLIDPASRRSLINSAGEGQDTEGNPQYVRGGNPGESVRPESRGNDLRRSGGGSVAFPVNYARTVPHEPSTYIPQGTAVRCVLQTLIMTDIPGPTSCNVVEDVRSFDARRVLIPKGSRVMGEYKPVSDSIDRVAIIWTRVITPDNIDISIQSPGISPLGTLGVKGEVDNRWGDRLSGALMISLASDALKYAIQTNSPTVDTVSYNALGIPIVTKQPFESATIRNVEKFVQQDLARSMRLTPRVVILQGTVVSIFTAQDLNFSQVMDSQ